MSDHSTGGREQSFPEPRGLALNVYGGHKLRATSHRTNQYGRFANAWECVSCGRESTSKRVFENNPCPEPILWVRIGCPGDGLRVCRECDTVYIGDYSRTKKIHERTCINCGSIEVYRDDDPACEPSLIQPSYDGTHRPQHTGCSRQEVDRS